MHEVNIEGSSSILIFFQRSVASPMLSSGDLGLRPPLASFVAPIVRYFCLVSAVTAGVLLQLIPKHISY